MAFPAVFAQLPGITVYDPLAELLGSAEHGLIEYRFTDAVKLTGHACPTVAASWRMTVDALRALYGTSLPERGAIEVDFPESLDSGVAGVMASVATLITGAAGSGGFKGLAGRYSRQQLLRFGVDGIGGIRFRRKDTGRSVECTLNLGEVPAHPQIGAWLGALLAGTADAELRQRFNEAWLARVQAILLGAASPVAIRHLR